jgi:hypothetical protein
MGSKSKNKGKSWEREFATFLSDLYGESFIRVPHSGAYIGGKNSSRKEFLHEGQIRSMKGDITPPADWKHFNVECKSYSEFPFHQLFTEGKIGLLEAWINQTLDAADEGDFSFIVMKFNRKGKFICFPLHFLTEIKTNRHIRYDSEKHGPWAFIGFDIFWNLNKDSVKNLSLAK